MEKSPVRRRVVCHRDRSKTREGWGEELPEFIIYIYEIANAHKNETKI